MKIPKKLLFSVLALVLVSSLALANGLNLNSMGSRAAAMGGAFVGLANDFSAIFWNPAGMTNFTTKYFGFYGCDILPSGTYKLTFPSPPLGPGGAIDAKTQTKHYLCGMAAYYHPISPKLVAGLGVYTPSGLGASWNAADFALLSGGLTNIEWMSKVGVVTIAPALAYKISEMFSVGASLNINYGMFDIKRHAGSYLVYNLGQYEESVKGWGYGASLGVLFKPMAKLSIGATFRSASTIKFEGDAKISNLSLLGFPGSSTVKREITWPMWIGFGVAYKPVDNLTLTADAQYTQWKKLDKIKADYTDPIWKSFMQTSEKDITYLEWKDATQLRFGAEYTIDKFAIRAGYYLDPTPAPDTTMNVLLPSYDFNNLTFGLGYALNGLRIDLGFEYLMGKERSVDFLKWLNHPLNPLYDPKYAHAQPGTYSMKIIVPTISISYTF